MNNSSFLRSPLTQCKRPVEKLSAPEIHTLRLVAGVLSAVVASLCASSTNRLWGSSRAWVYVLEKRPPFLETIESTSKSQPPAFLLALIFGIFLGWGRARPSPAKAEAMEHAARRLSAYQGGPLLEQNSTTKSLQLQRERSHP
jgi:hypothetical protein